jgi:hypothetical protein
MILNPSQKVKDELLALIEVLQYSLVTLQEALERDEDDDHTSVWGGAGPDCIVKRLVTA